MCSPKWGQTYIRNQVRPSIKNTIFVYNSQNPCLTTGLSYTALLQTQSPTQHIGSSSLWQWSPESLDYSSNSHLGSFHLLICLYTEFPWEHTVWGPKPRLHILNQYLLLIPSPVPSPRIPMQGASWSAVSPCFILSFQITVFSKRQRIHFSAWETYTCVRICPWMSVILSQAHLHQA